MPSGDQTWNMELVVRRTAGGIRNPPWKYLGIKIGELKLMPTPHNETSSQSKARDHTVK